MMKPIKLKFNQTPNCNVKDVFFATCYMHKPMPIGTSSVENLNACVNRLNEYPTRAIFVDDRLIFKLNDNEFGYVFAKADSRKNLTISNGFIRGSFDEVMDFINDEIDEKAMEECPNSKVARARRTCELRLTRSEIAFTKEEYDRLLSFMN